MASFCIKKEKYININILACGLELGLIHGIIVVVVDTKCCRWYYIVARTQCNGLNCSAVVMLYYMVVIHTGMHDDVNIMSCHIIS